MDTIKDGSSVASTNKKVMVPFTDIKRWTHEINPSAKSQTNQYNINTYTDLLHVLCLRMGDHSNYHMSIFFLCYNRVSQLSFLSSRTLRRLRYSRNWEMWNDWGERGRVSTALGNHHQSLHLRVEVQMTSGVRIIVAQRSWIMANK